MAGYSSITDEDRKFVEEWEHISPSNWGIIRLDARGDDRPEVIGGRRRFKLTTEERVITQDRIRDEALDPFLNGSFRPVVVPDSITVQTNPNALSDEEIKRILGSSEIAWTENLAQIDSVATVRRMLEVAEEFDEISLKRFRALEEKLLDVRGVARIEVTDPELKSFLSDKPGHLQHTNSGGENPRRKSIGGGRSSDYRDPSTGKPYSS